MVLIENITYLYDVLYGLVLMGVGWFAHKSKTEQGEILDEVEDICEDPDTLIKGAFAILKEHVFGLDEETMLTLNVVGEAIAESNKNGLTMEDLQVISTKV